MLLRWIRAGAKGVTEPQELARIEVQPREIVFGKPDAAQALRVIAVWADGDREDVTGLAGSAATMTRSRRVDKNGRVTVVGAGDTHVVAFYDNGVQAVPVMRPFGSSTSKSKASSANQIDRFVAAKLGKLGLQPSAPCTDAEFLRRVRVDLTGTLPSVAEIESFLQDTSKDKRNAKIDELLGDPTYAAWWANKLCDFTGCSPTALSNVLEAGQTMAAQWYDWIRHRIERNTRYDKIVEGIMLAERRAPGRAAGNGFKDRRTMPYYWTRLTVREPKQKAMAVAHSFLGVQLQCAECHKHPFDRWTQKDYYDFAAFFARRRGTGETHNLLRARPVTLVEDRDPREPVMAWMKEKDNPWFARAFVNRVWAAYFHRGIVDPPDAFTPANPPSHPELLAWLTQGFLESDYDMKWLHRQITTSAAYQRSWRPNATNRHDRRNFSRAIPRRIPAEVVYDALKQVTARTDRADAVRRNLRRRASGHLSMRMAGTHAMKVFGKPDRAINCDCERVNEPTLLQAIFLANDPLVRMRIDESAWLDRSRLPMLRDIDARLREAFLRTVNRRASEADLVRTRSYVAEAETKRAGFADVLWALVNTKEFILNH